MVFEAKKNQEGILAQRQEMDGLTWRRRILTFARCSYVDVLTTDGLGDMDVRGLDCEHLGSDVPGTALNDSCSSQSHTGVNVLTTVCLYLTFFSDW